MALKLVLSKCMQIGMALVATNLQIQHPAILSTKLTTLSSQQRQTYNPEIHCSNEILQ